MPGEWCMVCVINCCQFVRRLNMHTQTHTHSRLPLSEWLTRNSDSQANAWTMLQTSNTAMILRTRCTNYDLPQNVFFWCGQKVGIQAVTLKTTKNWNEMHRCLACIAASMRDAMDNLSFSMHTFARISSILLFAWTRLQCCCLLWTHNSIYSFKLISLQEQD